MSSLHVEWFVCDPALIPRASLKKKKKDKFGTGREAVSAAPVDLNADDIAAFQQAGFTMVGFDPTTFGAQPIDVDRPFCPTVDRRHIGMLMLARVSYKPCLGYRTLAVCPFAVRASFAPHEWDVQRRSTLPPRIVDSDTLEYRICSWNLLAPVYTSSEYAETLLFPFCKPQYLSYPYRKALTLEQLEAMKADIYCLQEVGRDVNVDLVTPFATLHNMESVFAEKRSKANEGLAVVYRCDKWQRIKVEVPGFADVILNAPEHEELRAEIRILWPGILEAVIAKLTTVYLLVALRESPSRAIIVANSHFYYHPYASHIRTLQAFVMLREIDRLKNELQSSYPEVGVILCGDFNADDNTGAIDLFEKGLAPPGHQSWLAAAQYQLGTMQQEGDVEESEASSLAPIVAVRASPVPFTAQGPLLKAPGSVTLQRTTPKGLLPFTTHVGMFKAVLDWIFTSPDYSVTYAMAGPSDNDIAHCPEYTQGADRGVLPGLPTAAFPSDHIPLVVDLVYRQLPKR